MSDDSGMPSAAADGSKPELTYCASCSATSTPWTTTCLRCGESVHGEGVVPSLASQLAAPISVTPSWVDIPISSDEPVKVALLCSFLNDNSFEYEQSRRFVSIPAKYTDDLIDRIYLWAFKNGHIDDPRHQDSLATTLHEIGTIVMAAIMDNQVSAGSRDPLRGIDLR